MRIVRIGLELCILAVVVCVLFFLYHYFKDEIHAFIGSLKLYALILLPVFFIIGIFLVIEDTKPIISTLSLLCLLVIAISGYGYLMAAFSGPSYDDAAGLKARLLRIYAAEFGIVLLMISSAVKSYLMEKRMSESSASRDETEQENGGYDHSTDIE